MSLFDPPAGHVLQLHVELLDVHPPIWRRLLVAADGTFWDLHVAIQDAMGWMDSHLHAFRFDAGNDRRGPLVGLPVEEDELAMVPGWTVPILAMLNPAQPRATYEYDFGDGWTHAVVLEAMVPADAADPCPRCIAGARSCPPEDVGGPGGYEQFLEAIRDPSHEEHHSFIEWCGGSFDPEGFDPAAVVFTDPRARLREVLCAEGDSGRAWPEPKIEGGFTPAQIHQLLYSPFAADSPLILRGEVPGAVYEDAPLVRDMLHFLRVVAPMAPVKLTQRGNLPGVVIRELAAVGALPVDRWRPGHTPRTEAEAPRAELLRVVADLTGLTRKQAGKLQITQRGGRAATGKMPPGALWQWLLERHASRLNWAASDRLPDSRMLQACFWYALFLLQVYGAEPRSTRFYAEKVLAAFPPLLGEFERATYFTPEQSFEHALTLRVISRFGVDFGLACLVAEPNPRGLDSFTVKAGPLLEACICWRQTPDAAAAGVDGRIIIGPWPGADGAAP